MKISPRARRQARRALVQALYQWQMSGTEQTILIAQFQEGESLNKADVDFFRELLVGVTRAIEDPAAEPTLDSRFQPYLDRQAKDLDRVELAVLRLGTYELLERQEIPYRVVIDEYVDLTKLFGAEGGHKYVNGVLDAVAKDLRALETSQHRAPSA